MHLVSTDNGDPLFLTESDTTAEMARMEGYCVTSTDDEDPELLEGLNLPIR